MGKRIAFLTMVAAVFLAAGAVQAEDRALEAEGSSTLSRKDAIRQAQRAAVEQGVGVFIQSETEVRNFQLKKDQIFSRTQGYVTRYSVIKDETVAGTYRVRIRATVSLDRIKDDLIAMQILMESLERPKLMVLVTEEYKQMDSLGMGIAGAEMASLLLKRGFELVDQAQMREIAAQAETRQALAGDVNAAQSLGLHFDSQYVVVGKAVVQDAGEAYAGSGLRSIQASLQTRVIQTQTGMVLGSAVKTGVAAHISPLTGGTLALRQAVERMVDGYLVDTVTQSFQGFLNNGAPIKLHITGVSSFRMQKKVAADIGKIERVVSSKKEGWNKVGEMLLLDLRFQGSSDDLANLLDGRKVGGRTLEVLDLAPERVDCRLR
jgi:hypothetical protein